MTLASRVAMTAFGLQAGCMPRKSGPNSEVIPNELPHFALLSTIDLVTAIADCIICALSCGAIFRLAKNTTKLDQTARYAIPAYSISVLWHLGFAWGVWSKSAFITVCIGIPWGAASNAALLTLLYVHPSALTFPIWRQRDTAQTIRPASVKASEISIAQDIATISCHDSPLEIQLMARLEKQFPEEEESRSYTPEPSSPRTHRIESIIEVTI
ncbi:hypothetical protein DL93DRAFT_2156529 [Clavulina sp. PMI_390]|nr:hypothetical protein DL93DRAFT_2156529 [Clavulina sp. PMI_390]